MININIRELMNNHEMNIYVLVFYREGSKQLKNEKKRGREEENKHELASILLKT